jgi:hypothetical protein
MLQSGGCHVDEARGEGGAARRCFGWGLLTRMDKEEGEWVGGWRWVGGQPMVMAGIVTVAALHGERERKGSGE